MRLRDEITARRAQWRVLTFYQQFEHVIVLLLTGLIAVVVVAAVWSLLLNVLLTLVLSGGFDPTDHAIFQDVFGRIFTVIIALEFKRSLLVVADRRISVVHVRVIILIAMLAIIRKLIILDMATTEATQLFALAAAILALGVVYWLVRDQDRREGDPRYLADSPRIGRANGQSVSEAHSPSGPQKETSR